MSKKKVVFEFLKNEINLFFVIVGAILLGFLLLIAVYAIPTENIDKHLSQSAWIFEKEGAYPQIISFWNNKLDNVTDALMMLEANGVEKDSIVKDAMKSEYYNIADYEYSQCLVEHYINGKNFDNLTGYSRYWHGYLLLLKPALFFFNYGIIRIINTVCQFVLVGVVVYLLFKRGAKHLILPFLCAYFILNPILSGMSLQFSSCLYISLLGIVVILLLKSINNNKLIFVFGLIGACTSYFDFLTYPLATFGLPMVVLLALNRDDKLIDKAVRFVICGFNWVFGYGFMWFGKWLVGSIVTGENIFASAFGTVAVRMSSSNPSTEQTYTFFSCVYKNCSSLLKNPILFVLLVVCLLYIINYLRLPGKLNIKSIIVQASPFVIVALLPLGWYRFTLNHSSIHNFYTCKILSVSVFSGITALSVIKNEVTH